jgi:AcrR family transcriptional regulator
MIALLLYLYIITLIMLEIQSDIASKINTKVYKKNPLTSALGKRILSGTIDLMSEIGFEDFTFKKLSEAINSTEATIYRYFENKHNLLTYLTMWYWSWLQHKCFLKTINIESPQKRLENVIVAITEPVTLDNQFDYIDEVKLNQIVITESTKVYRCKKVDKDNKDGFFLSYKELVEAVAEIVLEIDAKYPFPHMLVSTVIEGAHHQRFFAEHLPRLTNINKEGDSISEFFIQLVKNELKINIS